MRRIFYRLIVRRLEEVKNGAVIFYSGHFLVLLAVKVLGQQQAEGDWLREIPVSLALSLNSPILFLVFIEEIVPALSFYVLKCCHLFLFCCGAVEVEDNLRTHFTGCFFFYARPIGIALLNLEMPDRVIAVSLLPVFVAALILMILMYSSSRVLTYNSNLCRHFLPLIINICGVILPLTAVNFLLNTGTLIPCTWSLAIIATCLVTAVQGLVNISGYIIITWDFRQTEENPNTEEFKYHLSLLVIAVQLFYAVAVIFSGISENFLLKHSSLNCLIHLLNLFSYGRLLARHVSAYRARRARIRKLSSSLTTASQSELAEHEDVCSICYLELESPQAVITPCFHYFHLVCLKKWLISQDRDTCPLCISNVIH